MSDSSNTFLSNRTKRIVLVIFAFLFYYLVSYLLDPFSPYWKDYFKRPIAAVLVEWGISFFLCFLMAEASILIHNRLNRIFSWTKSSFKRMIVELALNAVAVLLIIFIYILIIEFMGEEKSLFSGIQPTREDIRNILQWVVVSLIISFMIVAINTGHYLINNWRNASKEVIQFQLTAAEHKQIAVEAELQALKLQTDPHFVFNNLSVLSELILKDQQLGYEYAENFSKVYRYLLVNSKKDIISLEEELKFLNAYLFLVKNRTGEGVTFEINIDPAFHHLQLPPLTLQLLVENALKHNQTTIANPLNIKILSTGHRELIVSNTMMPLVNAGASSGIGLKNIVSRYALLSEKRAIVQKTDNFFTVKIPLI